MHEHRIEAHKTLLKKAYSQCLDACEKYKEEVRKLLQEKGLKLQPGDTMAVDEYYFNACEELIEWYEEEIKRTPRGAKSLEEKVNETKQESRNWDFEAKGYHDSQ